MRWFAAWWSSALAVFAAPAAVLLASEQAIIPAKDVPAMQRKLGTRLVIVEASWDDPANRQPGEHQSRRIPGAVHVNTDAFENGSPRWHLRPLAELRGAIGSLGIGDDSVALVYSRQAIAAARIWWILHYAGVERACVIDGGLAAWERAGLPVESGAPPARPVARMFRREPRPGALAKAGDVEERRRRGDVTLVDVRSLAEHRGQRSGYSYLAARGRIPGAIYAGDADDGSGLYCNTDGTLRHPRAIAAMWREAGIDLAPSRELIFYCGTGWRSSLAYLYAFALGLPRIRNYSDGWSDWSTRFEAIPGFGGITPGWKQSPSGRPVAQGLD